MRVHIRVAAAGLVAAISLIPGTAGAADEAAAHENPSLSEPIASGLVGPLQLAAGGPGGSVWVAQGFAGVLSVIRANGQEDIPIPGMTGIDVSGIKVDYTTRADGEPDDPGFFATLARLNADGTSTQLADLWAYEQSTNPDQTNTYGFESITPECAALLPEDFGPAQYEGLADSNPYGVLTWDGRTYIADAGANAILKVTRIGDVRTIAVLPPQPLEATGEVAAAFGLPDCVVGLTYNFEPVPTDVEMGRDGLLYVSTLPGGPEDPGLGARGSVYSVDPRTGATQLVASGLLGATNVAIGARNTIYVSELFAGRVSRVNGDGSLTTVVELPSPAGLEYHRGRLYVSYDVFGDGKVAVVEGLD